MMMEPLAPVLSTDGQPILSERKHVRRSLD